MLRNAFYVPAYMWDFEKSEYGFYLVFFLKTNKKIS
jgi:hypothetical protein